jgi:two-component system, OmpR family, sensor kinase
MKSLRGRLLFTLYLAIMLVWVLTGVASYLQAYKEAGEMLDGQLAQAARLITAHAHQVLNQRTRWDVFTESMDYPAIHPYEQPMQFQVWMRDGSLLLRAKKAPLTPLTTTVGYSDIRESGRIWRTLTLWEPGMRFQVQVAQPAEERESVALEVSEKMALPTLLALPFLSMLIYLPVRQSIRPLETLAASVGKRTPENLQPLREGAVPNEVKPLIEALNRLLARLARTLENERQFTADAAHELRTPLAALKVQAQVALASTDDATRRHALTNTVASVERASRLIEQMLGLARLESENGKPDMKTVDLNALLEDVAGEISAEARSKHLRLTYEPSTHPANVNGDASMLRLALRNLLENAVRYTPEGGVVQAGIGKGGDALRLFVRDSGPGVNPGDLPNLTRRFYRGRDTDIAGSGLGLAIVERIAGLHGATLEIANRADGGLETSLTWKHWA